MPELPDITAYLMALENRVIGHSLQQVRLPNSFVLRTFDPPTESLIGKRCVQLRRLGKRIVLGFEQDLWIVIHLMIAGRLHWKPPGTKLAGKANLASFDFDNGSLTLTEAGSKRRAAVYVVEGEQAMLAHDPGGADLFAMSLAEFTERLTRENHTLKRVLTDPYLFSGIGNAYSDEILHAARLSPLKQSQKLTATEIEQLFHASRGTLTLWIERLQEQAGGDFPEGVTAFRPEMAVHGRFGEPCPECGAPVQRIRYAENETNYCARCQTEGVVLADRSLSRLLKQDWPRSIDEWE